MTADARALAQEALRKAHTLITDMSRFVGKMALQDYQNFNEAPIAINRAIAALTAEPAVTPDRERLAKDLDWKIKDAKMADWPSLAIKVEDATAIATALRQPVAAEIEEMASNLWALAEAGLPAGYEIARKLVADAAALLRRLPPVGDGWRDRARDALKARFRSICGPQVQMPADDVWNGYVDAVASAIPAPAETTKT